MRKLFKDSHPKLFDELHSSKNQRINFSEIFENSGLIVWWQCPANPKHVYKQGITRRTQQKYGCPYCSGRLTLPEESFAAFHPKLAAELHPTKNNDFDPEKYSPNSNKIVWWLCPKGHEWKSKIVERVSRNRSCETCRKHNNSFAIKYPKIAEEWHPTKNISLTPFDIASSYRKKVWWQCKSNPDHEWKTSVSTRVFSNTPCPKCSIELNRNKHLPPLNEFSEELAKQWHPTKNGTLKPSDVTAGSTKKVWWLCPNNKTHEWAAVIGNRTRKGYGCPKCRTYCSVTKTDKSLAVRFPNIAKQWHPTKNGGISPSDVTYGSAQLIWWQCTKNKSHEWQETVTSRTHKKNPNCPKCPDSHSSKANSLQQVFPGIAAEWHPTKNGDLKPEQVSRASGAKVWWLCPKNSGHTWNAQIRNRTLLKSGCPDCAKEINRIRLQEHLFDVAYLDIDFYHNFLSHIRTLKALTDLETKKSLNQPFLRMIYASVITSLETYLCDAFYKKVINSNDLIEKFIRKNKEFSEKKYSLDEIIDWQTSIKKKVTKYLFDVMWHNLPKVEHFYNNVIEVDFPEDYTNILRAINNRHDIVHRNGKNSKGSTHKISRKQVINLIDEVKEFVNFINNQILIK